MGLDLKVITFGLPLLLSGLWHTIAFCALSTVFGLMLAVIVALARLSHLRVLQWPALWYVELFRNTPFLVQVFTIYFILPRLGILFDATSAGIVALSLYAAAFFSESIRGAILSVPRGQMEAARAVGMSYVLAMRRIIFPQTLGYLLPSLTNQIIGVIKESAVLSVISVPEMAMAAQIILGTTFSPIESYLMVALMYWGLIAVVTALLTHLERKTVHDAARRPPQPESVPATIG